MDELIKINLDTERPTASARELWEFLEKPYTKFTMWFDAYKGYGFTESEDYRRVSVKTYTLEGGTQEAVDYEITVDMAKELAMLQKTEKGKQARLYFIDLEKKWNSPECIMARALQMAIKQIESLKATNLILAGKAAFYDAVAGSKDAIDIGLAAKTLNFGKGRTTSFQILRENGILDRNNIPYQEFIDRGYFRVVESNWSKPNGEQHTNQKTVVYQKGLSFIQKLLEKS